MKTWRVLGLFCASLLLGLTACGDSNKTKPEDSASGARGRDGGLDSGDEPDDTDDTGPDQTDGEDGEVTPIDDDAGADGGGGDLDACEPKGCRELGYNCGKPADDGCGNPLNCGDEKCDNTESAYDTCGGGGKQFVCGCTPATCDSLSSERGAKVCGTLPDGCGGTLECGNSCTGANTCGGGPAANECGCTPNPNPCAGKECGTASDGCGNTVQCGANAGTCSANKECSSQQTCTCKTDTTAFCAGKCGAQQTPDGCSVQCGSCPDCAPGEGVACGSTCQCPGTEICRTNQTCCVPEATATLCGGAVCGSRVNRCGQTVSCGTCGTGQICSSQERCEDPSVAALVGKYAARSVGFGKAAGIVTRAEGLLMVDIYRDDANKLVMREQSCWSGGFTRKNSTTENTVTTILPAVAKLALPTVVELDLTQSRSLPGAKEWVRGQQPNDQNVSGWRRGWPTYCPVGGGAPNPQHPDYGPQGGGPRAVGALKPWLPTGTACRCPMEEFAAHAPCQGLPTGRKATCMADAVNLSLPYSPGAESADSTVTDCRVVDDDMDGSPGATAHVKAELNIGGIPLSGEAIVRSASTTANVFWGKIDTSAAKQHWGVSQDQVGLQSANVACHQVTNTLASSLLCSTGSGDYCPGYRDPSGKDNRVNPLDFVSLHDKTAPTGGWTCEAIYDRRNDAGWFTAVSWASRYPDQAGTTAICTIDGDGT